MNRKFCTSAPVFALAAVLTALGHVAVAQPADGPPPGGDHPTDERLGDTSILMGRVAIPEPVDSCGIEPGYTRLLCLIDLLKGSVSDDVLELMQQDYSVATAKVRSNLPAGAVPARCLPG